jgi:hypothetical protein
MVLITSQNFGAAMADVVVDAMVAEKAREERYFAVDHHHVSPARMLLSSIEFLD